MFTSLTKYLPLEIALLLIAYSAYKILTPRTIEKNQENNEFSLFTDLKEDKLYQEKPKNVWISHPAFFNKVSVKEIEKAHQFEWKEDIITDYEGIVHYPIKKIVKELQPYAWEKLLEKPMVAELKHYLNNIDEWNEKVALKNFGNEIGWGVVAKEELKECGKFMTFYAGKVTFHQASPCTYAMHAEIGNHASVDAYKIGNMSRFMMHLPSDDDVIALPGIESKEIARANCTIRYTTVHENGIADLVQTKPIKPNEVIGFSYGDRYWGRRSFWLVDKNGNKMAKAKYDTSDNRRIIAAPG